LGYSLPEGAGNRFVAELLVCRAKRFGARFAEHACSASTRAPFAYDMPSGHELVERSVGCLVLYGHGNHAVEFRAHLLASPQADGDALMHAVLREAAVMRALMARPVLPLAEQMREVLNARWPRLARRRLAQAELRQPAWSSVRSSDKPRRRY
jgi:hypothetical protein